MINSLSAANIAFNMSSSKFAQFPSLLSVERKEKSEVGQEEEKTLSKSKDANHRRKGRQKINKEERRDLWIKEMKVERKETETIIIE